MTGPRAPRRCLYGCASEARLYPHGWRCVEHAPPPQPRPPVGTTLAEVLAEHGKTGLGTPSAETVVDKRAVRSGKRRASAHRSRETQAAGSDRASP